MLRFMTGGESHGRALIGMIEGMPSNLSVNIDYINNELSRRQQGYGRGGRMKIERDTINILSGVRHGKTTGAPISLMIENKDWINWQERMTIEGKQQDDLIVTKPRPGHADFSGAIKYNQKDIRNILERASARETAMRVAIGSFAKLLLKEFNIAIYSHVTQIGKIRSRYEGIDVEDFIKTEESPLRTIDKESELKMIEEIDIAKEKGDTLGGVFELVASNVPVGLGSHVHWDRKLDGKIAQGIMSLQGIKGVEIGLGFKTAEIPGSECHDELFYDGSYYRETNNAGGIEGGTSNGSNIIVRAVMKPIPTLRKPLMSVDMESKEKYEAQKERADVCAVPAASVVGESILAWTLAEELIIKFGVDNIEEIKSNYENYIDYVARR